jgi:hypothetical protein
MRRLVGMVEVRLFDVSRRNVEVGRVQAVERPETVGDEEDGRSSRRRFLRQLVRNS